MQSCAYFSFQPIFRLKRYEEPINIKRNLLGKSDLVSMPVMTMHPIRMIDSATHKRRRFCRSFGYVRIILLQECFILWSIWELLWVSMVLAVITSSRPVHQRRPTSTCSGRFRNILSRTSCLQEGSMGRWNQVLQLCLVAGLLAGTHAKQSRWERVLQTGAASTAAQAPAARLLPPQV